MRRVVGVGVCAILAVACADELAANAGEMLKGAGEIIADAGAALADAGDGDAQAQAVGDGGSDNKVPGPRMLEAACDQVREAYDSTGKKLATERWAIVDVDIGAIRSVWQCDPQSTPESRYNVDVTFSGIQVPTAIQCVPALPTTIEFKSETFYADGRLWVRCSENGQFKQIHVFTD